MLNREDNVVNVTESGGQIFFGVVKSARPVDSNIRLIVDEILRSMYGCTAVDRNVVPQAVEYRAVVRLASKTVGQIGWVVRLSVLGCDTVRR